MALKQIHVFKDQHTKKWYGELDDKKEKVFSGVRTQAEAIKKAISYAKKNGLEMIVHRADNDKIRMRNSYGHDPRKIRG